MLTLGWCDGSTFLPLAFSLLSSDNLKNRLCDMTNKVDKRTIGYRRRRRYFAFWVKSIPRNFVHKPYYSIVVCVPTSDQARCEQLFSKRDL